MVEFSKAKSEEKRGPRGPQWAPYVPPQRSFQARLRQAVRRYAFPAALLLSLAVVVGVLIFYTPLRATWWSGADQAAPAAADPPPAASPDPFAGETVFSVASQPAGAAVVLGTDTLGRTPLEPRAARAGAYVLSVYKEGYAVLDSVVFLRSDQPLALHLRLTPEEGASGESASEESASEEGASEEKEVEGAATASSESTERSAAVEDSSTSTEEREAAEARGAASQRAARYQALRDEADRFYARRKFEAAIEHYKAALRYRPGDEYATRRIQKIRKRSSVVGW